MRPYDRTTDELEDREAARREAQDRADRRADHAPAAVIPIASRDHRRRPTVDVDELERQRAAAGPRLVIAGDVVTELERQHRRAYHRRQEERARAARRRQAVRYGRDLLVMALLAGAGATALLALGVMFARGR